MKGTSRTRGTVQGWRRRLLLGGTTLTAGAIANAADDIRDIRGPKAVPGSWIVPAVIAGVLLIGLLVAYAIRRRRHSRARPRQLTLSEQTLERLEGTKPLMHPATAREFGIAASEVIRQYIEKRFEVIATQRTTEEFLQALLQSPNAALARHRSLLAEFLEQCDFVKFAGTSLAINDMEGLFRSARGFVLETGEAAPA
jgi:hypothetical protein